MRIIKTGCGNASEALYIIICAEKVSSLMPQK